MNWMKLMQHLPALIAAVEDIHGPGGGQTKKAAVMGLVRAGLAAGAEVDPRIAAVSATVDQIVTTMNAFKGKK